MFLCAICVIRDKYLIFCHLFPFPPNPREKCVLNIPGVLFSRGTEFEQGTLHHQCCQVYEYLQRKMLRLCSHKRWNVQHPSWFILRPQPPQTCLCSLVGSHVSSICTVTPRAWGCSLDDWRTRTLGHTAYAYSISTARDPSQTFSWSLEMIHSWREHKPSGETQRERRRMVWKGSPCWPDSHTLGSHIYKLSWNQRPANSMSPPKPLLAGTYWWGTPKARRKTQLQPGELIRVNVGQALVNHFPSMFLH